MFRVGRIERMRVRIPAQAKLGRGTLELGLGGPASIDLFLEMAASYSDSKCHRISLTQPCGVVHIDVAVEKFASLLMSLMLR